MNEVGFLRNPASACGNVDEGNLGPGLRIFQDLGFVNSQLPKNPKIHIQPAD